MGQTETRPPLLNSKNGEGRRGNHQFLVLPPFPFSSFGLSSFLLLPALQTLLSRREERTHRLLRSAEIPLLLRPPPAPSTPISGFRSFSYFSTFSLKRESRVPSHLRSAKKRGEASFRRSTFCLSPPSSVLRCDLSTLRQSLDLFPAIFRGYLACCSSFSSSCCCILVCARERV